MGLSPGPLLFTNEPEFTWGLIALLFLANVLTLAIAVCIIPFLLKILSVPLKYMIPCITVVCIVGSYSSSNSMYGVIIMFLSGGSLNIFFTRPITCVLMIIFLALVATPMIKAVLKRKKAAKEQTIKG